MSGLDQNNPLAVFQKTLRQLGDEDKTRQFLVSVERVGISTSAPDIFRVTGHRMDTGKPVTVVSKKSSSGQALPEIGSVMRADKLERLPLKNAAPDAPRAYKAEYFHAYGKDDLCLQAVVQPSHPREVPGSKYLVADVTAFDTTVNVQLLDMARAIDALDSVLVSMLKPWEAEKPSAITHDMKGDAIWSREGTPGAIPKVVIRIPGIPQQIWVSGIGAIREDQSGAVRAPTDEEILIHIRKNPRLEQVKEALKVADGLNGVNMVLIPAAAFGVGRDSLSSGKWLRIPQAFDWVDHQNLDSNGAPKTHRGCKGAFVHLKLNETGRLMVVDVVPSSAFQLTKSIPETKLELEAREAAAAAAKLAQEEQSRKAAEAQSQQVREPRPTPATTPHEATQPVPVVEDMCFADSDFQDEMAQDLAAMESMAAGQHAGNQSQSFDDFEDVDAVLAEATQRVADRANFPRM